MRNGMRSLWEDTLLTRRALGAVRKELRRRRLPHGFGIFAPEDFVGEVLVGLYKCHERWRSEGRWDSQDPPFRLLPRIASCIIAGKLRTFNRRQARAKIVCGGIDQVEPATAMEPSDFVDADRLVDVAKQYLEWREGKLSDDALRALKLAETLRLDPLSSEDGELISAELAISQDRLRKVRMRIRRALHEARLKLERDQNFEETLQALRRTPDPFDFDAVTRFVSSLPETDRPWGHISGVLNLDFPLDLKPTDQRVKEPYNRYLNFRLFHYTQAFDLACRQSVGEARAWAQCCIASTLLRIGWWRGGVEPRVVAQEFLAGLEGVYRHDQTRSYREQHSDFVGTYLLRWVEDWLKESEAAYIQRVARMIVGQMEPLSRSLGYDEGVAWSQRLLKQV